MRDRSTASPLLRADPAYILRMTNVDPTQYARVFADKLNRTARGRHVLGGRLTRWLAAGLALLVGLVLAPTTGAQAAGPAVVSVTVSVTNPDTGAIIANVDASTMAYYSVNVAYSCSVADCAGVQVFIDPTTLDPTYSAFRKESAMVFVPPFSPAPPIAGTLAAGYTVSLGTVVAGTGGSFSLQYRINSRPAGVQGGSFFIPGSPIAPTATISATNSDNPASNTGSASWVSTIPANPTLSIISPTSTRTDQPVTVSVGGDSRCVSYNGGGVLIGIPWVTCAASYEATVALPANAVYVPGSGGSYNPGTHTVTFAQSGQAAAGGLFYNPNSFQVTFPSSAYPTAGSGCVANETFSATETMTYLDGTVRTPTPATRAIQAQNCAPFAKGTMSKRLGGADGGTTANPILDIPVAPGEVKSAYWQVIAANQSNVAGIATITDNELDQSDLPVTAVTVAAGGPATLNYTLDNGDTNAVTVAQGATWTAPTGRRITAATVTSASLIGPNPVSTGTQVTELRVFFRFSLVTGATPGPRTNTATATITYPDAPQLGTLNLGPTALTVTLRNFTDVTLNAGTPTAAAAGGGTPIVGGTVTWTARAALENVTPGSTYRPQYVFLAPKAWNITPGSAALAGVPGATFVYRTVTYNGETYDAVIATWPGTVTGSGNFNLATLTVGTTPTGAAIAGTNNQISYLFAGDIDHAPLSTYYPAQYTDVTDFDGDGDLTEFYAVRPGPASLAPTRALGVTKEICRPDAGAADGCDWIANSSVLVGVAPSATSIKYRVTITNIGNADLSNVVAYDVLPFIGDTGTTDATAGTPRGSTVEEELASVSNVSAGLTLSYSASTNPSRPEVFTGTTDPADWGATVPGANAIRAGIPVLAANSSVSFDYEAALVGGSADEVACNSVAANAATLAAIEPAAVCATTQEADLSITVPSRLPLQAGRPGTIPFTVTNHGGSAGAPAIVTVSVPADVRVTSLDPVGWTCGASDTQPDGSIVGPVTLECIAVGAGGETRSLALNVPDALNIPAVMPDASLGGTNLCFPAVVSGLMFDPDLSNNDASACFAVRTAEALLTVEKTDGRTSVGIGDEYSYDIVIGNGLVGESLPGVVVTDTLPAGLVFVSATGGGVVSAQGPADAFGNQPGGVITWSLADLAAAGEPSADGTDGTGALGSAVTVTVTVRVVPGAAGDIINVADATAPDPFNPTAILEGRDTDIDGLYVLSLQKISDASASGVRTGQVLTYTVTARNTGTADFVGATIIDDLADVLDDASFVAGSGWVSIDGGTPTAVPNPTASELTWTGTIPAGGVAVLTYQVTVGAPGDSSVINHAATQSPLTDCDTATGLDEDGFACAVTATTFAPTIDKTVSSFTQEDDGTWSIVYSVDVVNPGDSSADYDLADDLAYGAGIEVLTAQVTDSPAGVVTEAWSGNGDVALAASVPAGDTHHYEVTVTADVHALTGTPSAVCAAGTAGGFANVAAVTLGGGTTLEGEACAEPVEPDITKELDGAPVQGADGNWTVSYLITVTNTATEPATGLSYSLADALSFPSGVEVQSVTVSTPAGVTANPDFTAGLSEVAGAPVPADDEVVDGIARVPAATSGGAGEQQYVVVVVVTAAAGSVDSALLACGAPGAGYGNSVSLFVGADLVGSDSACATILLPELRFTKTASASAGTRPGDRILYTITVTNTGDADFGTADPAMLVDDMTGLLDDARYNNDALASAGTLNLATPRLGWSGALAAGDTVTIAYSITLTAPTSGDGAIVNRIGLPGATVPTGGVPACADDPTGNAGAVMCAVTLQLDTRVMALTGMDILRIIVPGAVALLLLLGGGFLMLLRRRRTV